MMEQIYPKSFKQSLGLVNVHSAAADGDVATLKEYAKTDRQKLFLKDKNGVSKSRTWWVWWFENPFLGCSPYGMSILYNISGDRFTKLHEPDEQKQLSILSKKVLKSTKKQIMDKVEVLCGTYIQCFGSRFVLDNFSSLPCSCRHFVWSGTWYTYYVGGPKRSQIKTRKPLLYWRSTVLSAWRLVQRRINPQTTARIRRRSNATLLPRRRTRPRWSSRDLSKLDKAYILSFHMILKYIVWNCVHSNSSDETLELPHVPVCREQEAMELVPIFKKRHTSHILLQNRSCATFADYFFPLPYQLGVSAAATALAFSMKPGNRPYSSTAWAIRDRALAWIKAERTWYGHSTSFSIKMIMISQMVLWIDIQSLLSNMVLSSVEVNPGAAQSSLNFSSIIVLLGIFCRRFR